jgi:hypothetical protein
MTSSNFFFGRFLQHTQEKQKTVRLVELKRYDQTENEIQQKNRARVKTPRTSFCCTRKKNKK